jgi:alkylation response protein AidB-like acyl-CoA dehydrogenase
MGRHLLGTPFVATQLATQILVAGGSAEQQARWLPKIVAGSAATIAFTEDDGDWDLQAVSTTLEGGILKGTKTLVLDASVTELVAVSLLIDGRVAVAMVPSADIPATQITRDVVLDETRRSYTVVLDGVLVAAEQLITGNAAIAALRATEQAAWLLHAADACGGTTATIDLVVEYLNTRTQFGRKIGSYQALKHPTVDMLVGLERARSHVYHAASLLTAGEDAEVALRMAKADSNDAYNFAADRAIQFHGGFGFTYECDAQLYLRRALWLQCQFGDAPHHRDALQGLLLG